MENAEEYWLTARGVTRSDGARGKKQVWRPHARTWGLSEANVLHWSTVLVKLLGFFGALIVTRRPENCAPCSPSLRPWLLRAVTRLNKTMVHSSNQRHTGTSGFRGGGEFSIRPNLCATLRKTDRKVLQGDSSAKATCSNISGNFSWI